MVKISLTGTMIATNGNVVIIPSPVTPYNYAQTHYFGQQFTITNPELVNQALIANTLYPTPVMVYGEMGEPTDSGAYPITLESTTDLVPVEELMGASFLVGSVGGIVLGGAVVGVAATALYLLLGRKK
jgi:hypothetical protein